MSYREDRESGGLIYFCYSLPAVLGVLLFICALIPHIWFVLDGEAYSTMNLFELQSNAWDFYEAIQAGTIEDTEAARWFSQLFPVVSALFWILPAWYGIVTVATAICSTVAFAFPPTSRVSNRTKRIFHLICPNRICYLLLPLLPMFSALFPQMMLLLYRVQGLNMTLHAEVCHDWVLVLIAALINAVVYIALLPKQNRLRMDLFRIYRNKDRAQKEDEEA